MKFFSHQEINITIENVWEGQELIDGCAVACLIKKAIELRGGRSKPLCFFLISLTGG